MTIKLGIFADKPMAATGMAIVNHNLAFNLAQYWGDDIRPVYFGRFAQDKGVCEYASAHQGYEYVRCEGGVWKGKTVAEAIMRYKLDAVYSEDDWFSMIGLIKGTELMNVPFYFMTPIDSLPIQTEAHKLLKYCRKVFVPNQSYKYVKNGVFLPHAVDWQTFKPCRPKLKKFTFLWIGRAENRKNPMSIFNAFKKVSKKYDCQLVMRTGWKDYEFAQRINMLLQKHPMPIIKSNMSNIEHERLAEIYSSCHAYINTSKAGGCEMSVMEANACGLPTLVTDWTFMGENVDDGVTGFAIPIDSYDIRPQRELNGTPIDGSSGRIWGNISVDKLAEKMCWMLENQNEAAQMGINGILKVRQESWKSVTEKFASTILEDYRKLNKKGKR